MSHVISWLTTRGAPLTCQLIEYTRQSPDIPPRCLHACSVGVQRRADVRGFLPGGTVTDCDHLPTRKDATAANASQVNLLNVVPLKPANSRDSSQTVNDMQDRNPIGHVGEGK